MMSKCIIMYCLEGYNLKRQVMDNYWKKEMFSHYFFLRESKLKERFASQYMTNR